MESERAFSEAETNFVPVYLVIQYGSLCVLPIALKIINISAKFVDPYVCPDCSRIALLNTPRKKNPAGLVLCLTLTMPW